MSNPLTTSTQHALPPSLTHESPLLPSPLASTISLATRSSAIYLRLGTLIGRLALDSARITTLTSLELSRTVLERVLFLAGDDVHKRSTSPLGRQEADGVLERSLSALHATITSISFAASTGFHIGTAGLSVGSEAALGLLGTLDAVLGSTDSSRAIASIVALVKREFDNPATGRQGETVGVRDLVAGMVALALLQRWCRVETARVEEREGWREVVWDVVVGEEGRVDVEEGVVQMRNSRETGLGTQALGDEDGLRDRIMEYLPADATVSITAETTTTKTITVEITGAEPPDLPVPSGAEVVEEHAHFGDQQRLGEQASSVPYYRVVYRTSHTSTRGTDVAAMSHRPEMRQSSIMDSAPAARDEMDQDSVSPVEENHSRYQGLPDPSGGNSSRVEELLDTTADEPFVVIERPESPSAVSVPPASTPTSNQSNSKRPRQPIPPRTVSSGSETPGSKSPTSSRLSKKKAKTDPPAEKEKKDKTGGLMSAIRKGPQATLSNIMGKEHSSSLSVNSPTKEHLRPAWGRASTSKKVETKKSVQISPDRTRPTSANTDRRGSRAPQMPTFSRRTTDEYRHNKELPRPPSQAASFYEVHQSRRDSMVSQTETYSVHSGPSTRASSPTEFRHVRTKSTQSSLLRTRSEKNINMNLNIRPDSLHPPLAQPSSPEPTHNTRTPYNPSIYTLKSSASQTSLVLKRPEHGQYSDAATIRLLQRNGTLPGLFPQHHFIRNITRFMRFSSASYGSSFMRLMGISATPTGGESIPDPSHHYEHYSFSAHTQLPSSTILLSSFVDPQGGTDQSGQTGTNVPLVHFISLDHESKAVVLSCRGTLGFEDVLTDMTCDYDDMPLNGKVYRVHKGIYASARRLLSGTGCRVIATLAAALEEYPTYGLVMCGHSLGGGVVSLLAIMLSTPSSSPNTSNFLTAPPSAYPSSLITLPPNRPIHVFAYGPPATLSPPLRLATRGLITTLVHGADLVPFLSLGTLHDFQAVALAFKTDTSGASARVRARVWAAMKAGVAGRWYSNEGSGTTSGDGEEDIWAWAALKTLRAAMQAEKLVPPGEVWMLESTAVLQRDAFVRREGRGLGRPARRVVLRAVREVEGWFGEVRVKGGMLGDHSPGRYEEVLGGLGRGVLG